MKVEALEPVGDAEIWVIDVNPFIGVVDSLYDEFTGEWEVYDCLVLVVA